MRKFVFFFFHEQHDDTYKVALSGGGGGNDIKKKKPLVVYTVYVQCTGHVPTRTYNVPTRAFLLGKMPRARVVAKGRFSAITPSPFGGERV